MFLIKGFFALILSAVSLAVGLALYPSFSSLCAFAIVAIMIPLPLWNGLMKKCFGGARGAAVLLLIILSIAYAPEFPVSSAGSQGAGNPYSGTVYIPAASQDTASAPTEETVPAAQTTEPTQAATVPEQTEPATTVPGETEPEETEPTHVHVFAAATCTAPKTCACGATEGEPLAHDWKEATYSAAKTCRACGLTEGEPQEIPGKVNYHGHVYTGGDHSEKYHYEENCPGKNSHEITWEDVDRMGLGPCGTCVLK